MKLNTLTVLFRVGHFWRGFYHFVLTGGQTEMALWSTGVGIAGIFTAFLQHFHSIAMALPAKILANT